MNHRRRRPTRWHAIDGPEGVGRALRPFAASPLLGVATAAEHHKQADRRKGNCLLGQAVDEPATPALTEGGRADGLGGAALGGAALMAGQGARVLSAAFATIALLPSCSANNPLHELIGADDYSGLETALAGAGDMINEKSNSDDEQTPLMRAVLTGKTKAVQLLLAAGADTTLGEKDGYTPMHGAAFQGRADIAALLIAHGLNPSDRHADGYTPIHRACWGNEQRHTDTVQVLLDAGVSATEKSAVPGRKISQNCISMVKRPETRYLLLTRHNANIRDEV